MIAEEQDKMYHMKEKVNDTLETMELHKKKISDAIEK